MSHNGVKETGDCILDLWVYVWARVFVAADDGDIESRFQLLAFFGYDSLSWLHRIGAINWNPLLKASYGV